MEQDKAADDGDRIAYTAEQVDRGERTLARLGRFIDRNSHRMGAWPYICGRVQDLYELGRPIRMQGVIEDAREMDFADVDGNRVSIDNTYAAAMARLLLKRHPEYGDLMETRASVFDLLI